MSFPCILAMHIWLHEHAFSRQAESKTKIKQAQLTNSLQANSLHHQLIPTNAKLCMLKTNEYKQTTKELEELF